MRSIRTNILTPVDPERTLFLPDHLISIEDSRIVNIAPFQATPGQDYEDRLAEILCPGFIDTHVHLSQYRIRGLYEPALLPWLEEHVFPEEVKSSDLTYAENIAREFYHALFRAGTTTSVIYTAPFKPAATAAFALAHEYGIRAKIGMTMMDQNAPSKMLSSTERSFEDSVALYEEWDSITPRLSYIFTPRFAPTCSMELMRLLGSFIHTNSAWLQTHLSENRAEIEWVKQLFGVDSYTEAYHTTGMLSPRTILAHAIHMDEEELSLIRESGSLISHCPDSNFYLKSGEFPLADIQKAGIPFALGSDVGAGTSLSMLYHAKMYNYRQSKLPILPEESFYRITLGGAKLLGMDTVIGSIETGKAADMVFLEPTDNSTIDATILPRLVFYGSEYKLTETIVNGVTKYRSRP